MEYLSDNKNSIKIPLKFECPRCRGPVVPNYLHIGEEFNCPHCKEIIAVPESAVLTSEDSNVLYAWKHSEAIQLAEKKPTKEQMKRRFIYFYIVNIFIIFSVISIFPFILELDDIKRSNFSWFYILMILSAISLAIPFYLSFAAINYWGMSVFRKYRIFYAAIGIFFVILSALSVFLLSNLNTMPTD